MHIQLSGLLLILQEMFISCDNIPVKFPDRWHIVDLSPTLILAYHSIFFPYYLRQTLVGQPFLPYELGSCS